MELIVEDGTGLADADALASLEFVDSYNELRHPDWLTFEVDERRAAIRRVSSWASLTLPWKGVPLLGRAQGQAWPRTGVYDAYGVLVASDAVPREVQMLVAELAPQEAAEPGFLTPVYNQSEIVTRVKVGPVDTSFATAGMSVGAVENKMPAIMALVSGFLSAAASHGSVLSGRMVRV